MYREKCVHLHYIGEHLKIFTFKKYIPIILAVKKNRNEDQQWVAWTRELVSKIQNNKQTI